MRSRLPCVSSLASLDEGPRGGVGGGVVRTCRLPTQLPPSSRLAWELPPLRASAPFVHPFLQALDPD